MPLSYNHEWIRSLAVTLDIYIDPLWFDKLSSGTESWVSPKRQTLDKLLSFLSTVQAQRDACIDPATCYKPFHRCPACLTKIITQWDLDRLLGYLKVDFDQWVYLSEFPAQRILFEQIEDKAINELLWMPVAESPAQPLH